MQPTPPDQAPHETPRQIVIDVEGVVHRTDYDHKDVKQFAYKYSGDRGAAKNLLTMSFTNGRTSAFVSNETREQCFCLTIAADRRLSYQLSYTSQWTFLSKVMRRFHEALISDEQRVNLLKSHFASIKALFQGVEEFASFSKNVSEQVDDLSGNFEYQLGIDFSAYDPSNYFKSLRVFPCQDGKIRAFDELGTGQEQILAISFAWAYARSFHAAGEGLVLIIEEPESHLHPLACRWLSRRLHDVAEDGLQVVITTHSPAFLKVEDLPGFVRVAKTNGVSTVRQHTAASFVEHCRTRGAEGATAETTLIRYATWATEEIMSGLFARRCVLVEGATEALALPELLGRVGFDTEREGTAFINVQGVGNLAKWWRFFTAFDIPCYALFDQDEKDDKLRNKRRDLLNAIFLAAEEVGAVLSSDVTVIHDFFAMFTPDYERAMRDMFGREYEDFEREARDQHGLSGDKSKPLVARYAASRVTISDAGPAYRFLQTIVTALRKLVVSSAYTTIASDASLSDDVPF